MSKPKDLCYPGLESELWYPVLLQVLIYEIPTKIRMEEWLVRSEEQFAEDDNTR